MDIIIEAISTAAFIIGVFFGPALAVEAYKAVRS